jgi:hypothetical protein
MLVLANYKCEVTFSFKMFVWSFWKYVSSLRNYWGVGGH